LLETLAKVDARLTPARKSWHTAIWKGGDPDLRFSRETKLPAKNLWGRKIF
jgi:hypothetical protein